MHLEQTKSDEVARLTSTPNAAPPKPSDEPTSPPFFRLRDLPEELQRHIISFCLPPTWSIRASRPIRSTRVSQFSRNPFFYGLRQTPPISSTLQLVDKHTSHQVHICSAKNFTGELYLASVLGEGALTTYYQYGLGETPEPRQELLDGYRGLITTVHMGCYQYMHDSRGFDMSLISVLPKLRVVVAHSENRLHEESLYGWGDAEHLIAMISNEALVRSVQRRDQDPPRDLLEPEGILGQLWKNGLTTLHEMKVNMGSGEMTVSFYCVFWIREGRDAVVMGKYPVREWMASDRLRRRIYGRAVDEDTGMDG